MSSRQSAAHMVGRIESVYCKHFVSYNEITYYPKEYLNVLTGPNGTGKSTIVSAIILGLGGEPQLLDRSSRISDYIKSSKTSATLIITIYGRQGNSKQMFKRTINMTGESNFFVNSVQMSKKKFLEAVASFNIQVSNLCQFLPQDRVQDFSKMNPQELLINTMSSVCDDELMKGFEKLKELRSKQSNSQADREKDKQELIQEQKRLEQLKMSMEQYQERQDIVAKLNVYNAKKLWMIIEKGKAKIDNLKSQVDKTEEEYKVSQNQYEMSKKKYDEIASERDKFKQKSVDLERRIQKSTETRKNLITQLENIKYNINYSKTEMEKNIQQSSKNLSEVGTLTQLVESKQEEIEQFNSNKKDILSELQQHKRNIDNTREKTMNQYNKRRELEATLNEEKIPEITALTHQINRLQNVKTQKIDELKTLNPNLIKAMEWVAENKHKYKFNIYNPMIFELNIKSEEAAMCLENVVRQRDLYAFACEDIGDMSALTTELCVKQKLSVNILHCASADRCTFRPTIPISEIRQFGFNSYLVDLVSGPIPLINKLCRAYQIHNIPLGKDEVSNYTAQIPSTIRIYFGGNKKYSVTASRYRSDLILSESSVRRNNILITLDSVKLKSLKERHAKFVYEKDQIRNKLVEVDNEFEKLQRILKEEGEKKKTIEQKLNHYANLQNDVNKLMEKVNSIRNSAASVEQIQQEFKQNVYSKRAQIYSLECKLVKEGLESEKMDASLCLNRLMENVFNQYDNQMTALKECEDAFKEIAQTLNKLKIGLQAQELDVQSKTSEFRCLCNGQLPTDKQFSLKAEFKKLEKLELENVREAIVEFQARLDCMKNVNSDAISNYNQLEAHIESLKKMISDKYNHENGVGAEITNLYNEWEPKLTSLVETISSKFSDFMESISYVGEVILARKEIHDFNSYGIQIMVQYRKNAKLQTLDKYIQSGGERAVAIAIYSLSLQHVTSVPFRCVDEINQGMDAINERHIFELLLKEATKPGSAQYLFVTPKLLPDLNYNEHLCVSVVYNSVAIKSNAKFPLN